MTGVTSFKCSNIEHYVSTWSIKVDDQATPSKKKIRRRKRKCYGCRQNSHDIVSCPNIKMMVSCHPRRDSLARKQTRNKMRICIATRTRTVFATLDETRNNLVKIVPWVTIISLFVSIIIICLGRIKVVPLLLLLLVHRMLMQRVFGCLNLLRLTSIDTTWFEYHKVVELLNRYMEMH
jgi:hypothetical protein